MGNCCECFEAPTQEGSAGASAEYPQLDEEERKLEQERVRDAFDIYDKNKDGKIQRDELAVVLELFLGHKPTAHQLDNIFKKIDSNLDGVIDFPEFERMMLLRKRHTKRYISLFNQYDRNGDGFISKDELLQVSLPCYAWIYGGIDGYIHPARRYCVTYYSCKPRISSLKVEPYRLELDMIRHDLSFEFVRDCICSARRSCCCEYELCLFLPV